MIALLGSDKFDVARRSYSKRPSILAYGFCKNFDHTQPVINSLKLYTMDIGLQCIVVDLYLPICRLPLLFTIYNLATVQKLTLNSVQTIRLSHNNPAVRSFQTKLFQTHNATTKQCPWQHDICTQLANVDGTQYICMLYC